MRISQLAIDRSEPLFQQFTSSMWLVRNYHVAAFERRRETRDLYSETLRVLNSYQQDRCQAAYLLIVNGLVWDAEIIIRSLYEAFSKAAFLATASEGRRRELLTEFWEILPAIYDRQTALKAKPAESLARHSGKTDDARIFQRLRDSTTFNIDPVANKRSRNEIERRWSFSGILETLKTGSFGHGRLRWIETLAHMYGVSSHLIHADPKAFDLLEDRVLRGDDLTALEIGHVCRMLSDMVWLSAFSLHLCEKSWTGIDQIAEPLREAMEGISIATAEYRAEFDRSQDGFYADQDA